MTATIACSRASCPSRADAGTSPRTAAPGGRARPPIHRLVQRADRARSRGGGRPAVFPGRPADADAPGGPAASPAAGVDPPRTGFIRAEGVGKALRVTGRSDRGAGRRGRPGASRPVGLPGRRRGALRPGGVPRILPAGTHALLAHRLRTRRALAARGPVGCTLVRGGTAALGLERL